jgi:BirA family transcriptional regulator, biotin operon repressor / biotin---[acetyl-CoA-carboxylase] ligase
VQSLPTVGSTMDVALGEAHRGAGAGLLLIADEQTVGRGRRGHEWASPPGAGLYFSLLLRPPVERSGRASLLALLTLGAGVAVAEGVTASTGLNVGLKWPNDVLVERRKLAGVLAEGVALGTSAQSVVLGIGINVSEAALPTPIVRRATSLAAELGRVVDRGDVLAAVLAALARQYRSLLDARYDDVLNAWRVQAPSSVGTEIEWDAPHGVSRGVTAGIDDSGALLVRTTSGVERIIAGEIRWR